MKTLVIYYSYTGHTKRLAEDIAAMENAEIAEIKPIRRPGNLKAYTMGCFDSLRGKSWTIHSLEANMEDYDRLIFLIPVWAGNPPPFVNSVLEQLPEGKTFAVKMISSSGESKCKKRIKEKIKAKGGILESFEDIKARQIN
jgi:flavodoxin